MDKIKNASDLLDKILKKKILKAEKYHKSNGTKHPGLLGDIYEGITSKILEKTVFEELDLKVVTGQIRLHNGELSNQVDCMIVKKIGCEIPYTGKYECNIDDVIAVVEVKKTLYKSELEDSLLKMQRLFEGMEFNYNDSKVLEDDIYRAYEMMTGNQLDDINLYIGENLDEDDFTSMLVNLLIMDYKMPLRIIIGYDGYKDEITLREGFLNVLQNNNKIKSGTVVLPNIIISRDSALIKTNGIPYGLRMKEKSSGEYVGFASYNRDCILILLEVIWTKLCSIYTNELDKSIFGDYVTTENIVPLFICHFMKEKGFGCDAINLKRINLLLLYPQKQSRQLRYFHLVLMRSIWGR